MSRFNLSARAACGILLLAAALAWTSAAHACACGCGVFDVGASALLPQGATTTVFLQQSYLDQNSNWAGSSSAPKADNDDKHIRSEFSVLGVQQMFNRDWGMLVTLPYTQRHFATIDEDSGELGRYNHGAIGDIRISGIYSGFSDDMSSGITFGVKLANGDWTYRHFDRDTAIGTGTTDLLLGGYRQLYFGNSGWGGFVQAQLDQPLNSRDGYRPGSELNGIVGAYPGGWNLGGGARITPILQAIVSLRTRDHGANADPFGSGYQRLLFAPALELRVKRFRVYADVEAPVFQHVNGNQLVPRWQSKLMASVSF